MLDLFYLHVPKTGGTSIETYMRKAVGSDRFLGHCETLFKAKRNEEINAYRVASGHLRLHQLLPSGIRYQRLMTSIRDPKAQLISHIRWLVRIGENKASVFYRKHPENIRETATKLATINFSDKATLDSYVTEMSNTEIGLFDNFLVRFLSPLHVASRVEQQHVDAAVAALPKFDFIVRTEHLHEDMTQLFATMGYAKPRRKIHENTGMARVDKSALSENLEYLEDLYRYDLMLIKQWRVLRN